MPVELYRACVSPPNQEIVLSLSTLRLAQRRVLSSFWELGLCCQQTRVEVSEVERTAPSRKGLVSGEGGGPGSQLRQDPMADS